MKLFLNLFLVALANGKILIDKWEMQVDPSMAEVKKEIKDHSTLYVDVKCLMDADDVVINVAAFSKVDGVYNPFVKPDPIHICTVHEHDDPMVQFMHEEVLKFGNITKACPLRKGAYYYLHGFTIDEAKFPVPLPEGEFRIDVNASVIDAGKHTHAYSSELFFRTVMD